MKSLLLVLLSSVFVFSASDSLGKDTLKRNLAYEDLQVGHWYNFYFLKGHSSFAKATVECKRAKTSVNVHAAKVVSKKSKSEVTITFPKGADDHLSNLSARAKDAKETGSATVEGLNFKKWERTINEWSTVFIDLKNTLKAIINTFDCH